MLITDSTVSKPIKRENGTYATLKTVLPYAEAEEHDGKRGVKNEKKLNELFTELAVRLEKKASSGNCENYVLSSRITQLDSEYISVFFEAYSRIRGKTVSYSPFSVTYSFRQSRFCRACEFCTRSELKNAAGRLPSANVRYSFYLNDGCITFFERRADTNRIAKLSIPTL